MSDDTPPPDGSFEVRVFGRSLRLTRQSKEQAAAFKTGLQAALPEAETDPSVAVVRDAMFALADLRADETETPDVRQFEAVIARAGLQSASPRDIFAGLARGRIAISYASQ